MKQTKIEADYCVQLLRCINLEILIDEIPPEKRKGTRPWPRWATPTA
jgi:hypothetical protein